MCIKLFGILSTTLILFASEPSITFDKIYGGKEDDVAYDIEILKDGYLIVGDKKSRLSRDSNVWLLKVDKNGKLK